MTDGSGYTGFVFNIIIAITYVIRNWLFLCSLHLIVGTLVRQFALSYAAAFFLR